MSRRIEKGDYAGAAQKSIAHCLKMLAAPKGDETPGQARFIAFTRAMYVSMLIDPSSFGAGSLSYDAYLQTAKAKALTAEKVHAADSRESQLRNVFQRAIAFYPAFLFALARRGEPENGALALPDGAFDAMLDELIPEKERGERARRISALESLGLIFTKISGVTRVAYPDAPEMLAAMRALANAPDSPYRYLNFLRADFRGLTRGAPTVEDVAATLPESLGSILLQLDAALKPMHLKFSLKPMNAIYATAHWKGEYLRSGKAAFGFYADGEGLTALFYFGGAKNITDTLDRMHAEDPALAGWLADQLPERLCKCPNNRRVKLPGGDRRVCGLMSRAEIENPDARAAEKILRALKYTPKGGNAE